MKAVSVTEFKAHCLRLFDEAQRTGETIEVFKRGKRIATVQPEVLREPSYEPGQFKDQFRIVGDLDDLGVEWEALE
ncbi:type II toxin-antitoxin system Phd/YefM family antitoxin [bacterium]|nr:MAG: type II toxin-antitoxin system Phd/YefM family antitoxin [bacterium]